MLYEIVTNRFCCPECQGPLRLRFEQGSRMEEVEEVEYLCEEIVCPIGHGLPEELVQEAMAGADAEFYAALERGGKLGEIWAAPPADQDPGPVQEG